MIDKMFTEGKTVAKYPLRLVYTPLPETETIPVKIGVSVSKKHFKRATDRNYYKRLLRESYRLNKHMLADAIKQPTAFMFFYQTKDRLTFAEVNALTVLLFEKFRKQEGL